MLFIVTCVWYGKHIQHFFVTTRESEVLYSWPCLSQIDPSFDKSRGIKTQSPPLHSGYPVGSLPLFNVGPKVSRWGHPLCMFPSITSRIDPNEIVRPLLSYKITHTTWSTTIQTGPLPKRMFLGHQRVYN